MSLCVRMCKSRVQVTCCWRSCWWSGWRRLPPCALSTWSHPPTRSSRQSGSKIPTSWKIPQNTRQRRATPARKSPCICTQDSWPRSLRVCEIRRKLIVMWVWMFLHGTSWLLLLLVRFERNSELRAPGHRQHWPLQPDALPTEHGSSRHVCANLLVLFEDVIRRGADACARGNRVWRGWSDWKDLQVSSTIFY